MAVTDAVDHGCHEQPASSDSYPDSDAVSSCAELGKCMAQERGRPGGKLALGRGTALISMARPG